MDFALAPEDEAFRDEFRAWLDKNLPPFLQAESLADDASLSGEASQKRRQAWQRKMNEGGWAAIHWGEEYGGRTINAMQRLIYSEVLAEYRTPGMFNTNGIWQIGPMIIAWGTEEQKAQWLPSILGAEEHWCQGFSEPDAGNDLANLRTLAIRDGDDYVVNGSKIWISSAHLATWGLFLLRTDPTAVLGLPLPDPGHEGLAAEVVAALAFLGQRALHDVLGGDPRVVGAGQPQRVVALHPAPAGEGIHEGVPHGVADVHDPGDVGRGDDDAEGLPARLGGRGEHAEVEPALVAGALYRRGVVRRRKRVEGGSWLVGGLCHTVECKERSFRRSSRAARAWGCPAEPGWGGRARGRPVW